MVDFGGFCVGHVLSIVWTRDTVISKQAARAFIVGLKIGLKCDEMFDMG